MVSVLLLSGPALASPTAASERSTAKARTVALTVPTGGDLTIARLVIDIARPAARSAKARRTSARPTLALKATRSARKGLALVGGVWRTTKARRYVALVAITNPSARDVAGGRSGKPDARVLRVKVQARDGVRRLRTIRSVDVMGDILAGGGLGPDRGRRSCHLAKGLARPAPVGGARIRGRSFAAGEVSKLIRPGAAQGSPFRRPAKLLRDALRAGCVAGRGAFLGWLGAVTPAELEPVVEPMLPPSPPPIPPPAFACTPSVYTLPQAGTTRVTFTLVCSEPFVTTELAPIAGNPIASMGLAAGANCAVATGAARCDHTPPTTTTTLTPRFTSNVNVGDAFGVTATSETGTTSDLQIVLS